MPVPLAFGYFFPMKFLHTRIRVSDLEKTISFYEKLGFACTKRMDSPAGNKLAYLEVPGNAHLLELCWSPEYKVAVPEDLMHTCVGVDDIISYCDGLEKAGIALWPENWRSVFSTGGSKMAFVTDPDNYEIEILEK